MKKLDIEFIREQFEKEGYKLISNSYIDAHSKLKFVCDKGHVSEISWGKFKQGRVCKYCNGRIYYENIKEIMLKEGYILLSSSYNSSKKKLKYKCYKGHIGYISWSHWQHGSRCKTCFFNSITKKFSDIKNAIENESYKLITLSSEYKDQNSILKCQCSKGHTYLTTWAKWRGGVRCKICSLSKRDSKARLNYADVKNSFNKENYILLSKKYNNAFSKLDYICSLGHNHSIKWNDWQQGYRCPICANDRHSIRFSGSGHPNWKGGISYEPYCPIWKDKEYKEDIKLRDGYKCLNPCCDSKKPNDLVIHHIDYNKKNCGPKNLITVCRSCNNKANYSRNWHTFWYQAILTKRYNYKY